MALDHILLGLIRHPASGNELCEWFAHAFHHFWAAEPSQIYRTLTRLEQQGLASTEKRPSAKGPPQRVYSITPNGAKALEAWLRDGPSMSDTRLSQLAQLVFLGELPADRQRAFLEALRDEYSARLHQLDAVIASTPDRAEPAAASDEDDFFRRLTVSAGLHQYESWIRWIDHALAAHETWAQARTGSHHTKHT
ncbi:MAG: PadR family transcriptional regulator [Planctomycetota bacterium]